MNQLVASFLEQHPGVRLFPNLHTFGRDFWINRERGQLPPDLLIGPNVKSVYAEIGADFDISSVSDPAVDIDVSALFKSIVDVRPPLELLRVSSTMDIECPPAFHDIIQASPCLKSVEVPWLWFPPTAVRLSNLSGLKELTISTEEEVYPDDVLELTTSFRWPPSPFPSLGCLNFSMKTFGYFSNALQAIPPLYLAVPSLTVTFDLPILLDEMDDALKTIASHFEPSSLRILNLDESPDNEDTTDHTVKDGPLFEPLLAFFNLESVSLLCEGLYIGDTWLKKMVEAWPNLKSLSIVANSRIPDDTHDQYTTLDGLSYVASSCRNLLELRCHVDLRDVRPFADDRELNESKYGNNQVTKLVLADPSLISDDMDLARILCTFFPGLRDVTAKQKLVDKACKGIRDLIAANSRKAKLATAQ